MIAERRERGSVTVFTVIMTVALLFMAGLVIDGGQILNARREAANVAESAARAGAQELDEDVARTTGATTLDKRSAVATAEAFLAASGHQGMATATGDVVTVTVSISQPLLILGIGGLADVTVTGTGSASPLRAISENAP